MLYSSCPVLGDLFMSLACLTQVQTKLQAVGRLFLSLFFHFIFSVIRFRYSKKHLCVSLWLVLMLEYILEAEMLSYLQSFTICHVDLDGTCLALLFQRDYNNRWLNMKYWKTIQNMNGMGFACPIVSHLFHMYFCHYSLTFFKSTCLQIGLISISCGSICQMAIFLIMFIGCPAN